MCGRFTVLTAEELRAVVSAVGSGTPCQLTDAGAVYQLTTPRASTLPFEADVAVTQAGLKKLGLEECCIDAMRGGR